MNSLRRFVLNFRRRPKAYLAVALFALANQPGMVSLAAAPAPLVAAAALHANRAGCAMGALCALPPADPSATTGDLSLPRGASQCADSGPEAACAATTGPASLAGTASLPTGATACPMTPTKPVPATPAACSETPSPAGQQPADIAPSSPLVLPSVPTATLGAFDSATQVTLTSNLPTVRNGQRVVLTASSTASVTGTGAALEIFDRTSGRLLAACSQGNLCSVGYAADSGVHTFSAFITAPTTQIPGGGASISSSQLKVGWLDSSVTADHPVVGPGQAVTITATSTVDVRNSGRWLEIYDLTAGRRLTYCAQGTSCSTAVRQTTGGVHEIVGYVNGTPEAVSKPVYVTWLSVSLSASSVGSANGGTVYLKASVNADLAATPYVVGIYDQQGRLVDHACKSGASCSVVAYMNGGTPTYTAMIGQVPAARAKAAPAGTPGLVNVVAKSTAMQPTHVLWGVDSCKAIVGDPSGDLYWKIVRGFGTPEFWGRYLTNTVCPGISSAEIALAAKQHLGILPIYNDYDCSNVSYYDTGHGYAAAAVAAAQRLGIPQGRLLAIDIEPAGAACPGAANVDSGFIEGWYDGVRQGGYVPMYYGNGTAGSEFASAWCSAVSSLPQIASGSDLWSFEPSLLGALSKPLAPSFAPYDTGCSGNIEAWQYQISSSDNADVDQDEALSSLSLWYPSA